MKKFVIVALAASTAITGVMSAGVAAAQQPGYHPPARHDQRDHRDVRDSRHDQRDHRDVRRDNRQAQWERWYRYDRWDHGHRYYGGKHGYKGYRGPWRTGQRFPYYRDTRYVITDYRAYHLPPPQKGYRYYRDDRGDIVMAAITSGIIGLIIGSTLND